MGLGAHRVRGAERDPALAAMDDPTDFRFGRAFTVWLPVVPILGIELPARVAAADAFAPLLESCFRAGGVHVVEVPIDYRENRRVLIDELAGRVCLL